MLRHWMPERQQGSRQQEGPVLRGALQLLLKRKLKRRLKLGRQAPVKGVRAHSRVRACTAWLEKPNSLDHQGNLAVWKWKGNPAVRIHLQVRPILAV